MPAYCTELASHALSVADMATSTLTSRATVLSSASVPLLDPVAAWRAVAATRKRSVRVLELCDELSGLLTQEGMWVTLYKTGGVARESVAPAVPLSVWDALTRPVSFGAAAHEEQDANGGQQDFWVDSSSDDEERGSEGPGARLREGIRTVLGAGSPESSPQSNGEEPEAPHRPKSSSGWRAARVFTKPLVQIKQVRAVPPPLVSRCLVTMSCRAWQTGVAALQTHRSTRCRPTWMRFEARPKKPRSTAPWCVR